MSYMSDLAIKLKDLQELCNPLNSKGTNKWLIPDYSPDFSNKELRYLKTQGLTMKAKGNSLEVVKR